MRLGTFAPSAPANRRQRRAQEAARVRSERRVRVDSEASRANAALAAGDWPALERIARAALANRPDHPDALIALAQARYRMGDADAALAPLRRAIEIEPGRAEIDDLLLDVHAATFEPGKALLRSGNFRDGWPEVRRVTERALPASGWRYWGGGRVDGPLFIVLNGHYFGGFGDVIQFARFLPRIAEFSPNVVVMGSATLLPLLQSVDNAKSFAWLHVAGRGGDATLPPGHITSSIHIPAVLAPEASDFGPVPYLHAESGRVSTWSDRLSGVGGLRIGVAWSGSPGKHGTEAPDPTVRRAFPLSAVAPLASIPGVSLVSLQIGEPSDQVASCGFPIVDPGLSLDWMETAALVESLDLVVSLDSAVCHLAGALGRPVWAALPYSADWRWFDPAVYPDTSPWYPSMRLFRQERPGDWSGVFSRMAVELEVLARSRDSTGDGVVVG